MKTLLIAEIVHEANRVLTLANGSTPQPHWDDAPQRMRDDSLNMVQHTLAYPEKTAEQDHENWLAGKRAAGWVWGPDRSEMLKTHPLMIPYSELPAGERLKNAVLPAIILACARAAK